MTASRLSAQVTGRAHFWHPTPSLSPWRDAGVQIGGSSVLPGDDDRLRSATVRALGWKSADKAVYAAEGRSFRVGNVVVLPAAAASRCRMRGFGWP